MCGRFALYSEVDLIRSLFRVTASSVALEPRYNVAPTQPVGVIRERPDGRRLDELSWGFVPSWSKGLGDGPRPINARSESVSTNPAFKTAIRTRRCVIPADGFYEWQVIGEGKRQRKQPLYIQVDGGEVFGMAGIWELWRPPDPREESVETFAIITTDANDTLRPIHDRMPVILNTSDVDTWLDHSITEPGEIRSLMAPFPNSRVSAYPVSTHVNAPANDDEACIREAPPVAEQDESEGTLWGGGG